MKKENVNQNELKLLLEFIDFKNQAAADHLQTSQPTPDQPFTFDLHDESVGGYTEGYWCIAKGAYSHAEGGECKSKGRFSHAEGMQTKAKEQCAHAEGSRTVASGYGSHAEGTSTKATANSAHAEGIGTRAKGYCSHAEGKDTIAKAHYSHASGLATIANSQSQFVIGQYNAIRDVDDDDSDMMCWTFDPNAVFVIGCGESEFDRGNCFRVGKYQTFGNMYNATGRGYAELFEWEDGNPNDEDRVGRFVSINGNKISYTNDLDEVFGVTSDNFAVCGNVWDDFSSEWTKEKEYSIGKQSVDSWQVVVTMGSVIIEHDGTINVNGYVKPDANGCATISDSKTPYRVLEMLDDKYAMIYIR